MIDINMFEKQDIIDRDEKAPGDKTWANAKICFDKPVASKEWHASVSGGTAKKACFESAARVDE